MKLSQLKQIIKEEIEGALKEAPKSPTLKDLDFNKFEQILKLVTTPLTTAMLDDESEGYEGSTISGFKKFKGVEYLAKFLKKFSELYTTGDKADYKKVLNLLSDNTDTLFHICDEDDSAEMLKDKKLAKSLTDVNEALSSFGYSVYEIDPDYVAKDYNKLADAVAKFGAQKTPQTTSTSTSSPASSPASSPTKTYTSSDMAKLVNSPDFDQKYTITTNANGEMVITPKK
jgi:hypothetical protein